jgi:hypothetical protein
MGQVLLLPLPPLRPPPPSSTDGLVKYGTHWGKSRIAMSCLAPVQKGGGWEVVYSLEVFRFPQSLCASTLSLVLQNVLHGYDATALGGATPSHVANQSCAAPF